MVACGVDMKIFKEEAIKIANNEIEKLGYDVKNMEMEISKYNTPWNKYLPKNSDSEYIIERKNKLINKEYWAIYYKPKGLILGGDICVFVDSTNGEIITTIRGK